MGWGEGVGATTLPHGGLATAVRIGLDISWLRSLSFSMRPGRTSTTALVGGLLADRRLFADKLYGGDIFLVREFRWAA